MTIDERLQALAETVEIIAGMQEKNERSIEALAVMQVRTFEVVRAVAESVDKSIQSITDAVKHMDRNMEVLVQYAHRHEDWLEQLEKRGGTQ